jgi:hypothetical protein
MFWWQSLAASGTTIGFLSARSASGDTHLVAAFRQGLAEAPGVLAASQTFTTSQAGRGRRQEGQLSLATNVRPGSITSFRAQASTSALPRRLDLLDTDRLFGTTQDHGSSPLADDHDVVLHRFSFHALPSPASPGSPAQHTVARGRSLWGRIAVGHPPCDKSPMAALGQSRCFERALTTSELPRRPDSATQTGSSDEWSRMKIATGRYL